MPTNIERYRNDLDKLVALGERLKFAMELECFPDQYKQLQHQKPELKKTFDSLPAFRDEYQAWYSEAKALVRQLLPDRLDDFVRHYEKPKPRKEISNENYRIEDYLQGLSVTRGYDKEQITGPAAAVPHFHQQLNIVRAVKGRFESSLFDIRQLVQADILDSEISAADELAKKGFGRAAGAVAGVVLEKHLAQVCSNHSVQITKKNPTIGDLNDALRQADVMDVSQWRFTQHLADIRNICDHNKKVEPTGDQVQSLIQGVAKTIKTLF